MLAGIIIKLADSNQTSHENDNIYKVEIAIKHDYMLIYYVNDGQVIILC